MTSLRTAIVGSGFVARVPEFACYPSGHAEGYGDAFRVILTDAYRAMAGESHGSFPTFADRHRGMQVLGAACAARPTAAGSPQILRSRLGAARGAAHA